MPWIEPVFLRNGNNVLFTSFSPFSQGGDVAVCQGNRPNAAAVWPTLDRIIAVPVQIDFPCTVSQLAIYSAVQNASSKIDVGLHAEDGTVLTSMGLTSMAAAGVQLFDVANVSLAPATYILSMVVDVSVATATFFRATVNLNVLEAAGVFIMDVAGSTPIGTLTYAAPAASFLPIIAAGGTVL